MFPSSLYLDFAANHPSWYIQRGCVASYIGNKFNWLFLTAAMKIAKILKLVTDSWMDVRKDGHCGLSHTDFVETCKPKLIFLLEYFLCLSWKLHHSQKTSFRKSELHLDNINISEIYKSMHENLPQLYVTFYKDKTALTDPISNKTK